MRTTDTVSGIQPEPGSTPRRGRTTALWVLQGVLAFLFVGGGWLKLTGDPEMVEMFTTIGASQWFRMLVGALEGAGAIGLLIPRLAGLAALGLSGLLVGAIGTNLFILDTDPWVPIGMLVMSALIAWGRWPQIRPVIQAMNPRGQ